MLTWRFSLIAVCVLVWGQATACRAADFVLEQISNINVDGDSVVGNAFLTEFNNDLYFRATGPGGLELYRTDGQSVELVADINPTGDSSPYDLTEFNNHLYFGAQGTSGFELYRTDGTNTTLFANLNGTAADSVPRGMIVFNDHLWFSAKGESGNRLYRSDGQTTEVMFDVAPTGGLPKDFVVFKDELYFSANGKYGVELYKTNGTDLTLLGDINPDGNAFPDWLTPYGDQLVFNARSGLGTELYATDGQTIDFVANLSSQGDSLPNSFTEFNGDLYFGARSAVGTEVLKYDGDRVTVLEDLDPSTEQNQNFPREFSVIGDQLYFSAVNSDGILVPFRTDGDLVTQLADDNSVNVGYQYTSLGDSVIFGANTAATGFELFEFDGMNINLIEDILPGNANSLPDNLTIFNGSLIFSASGEDGSELYRLSLASTGQSEPSLEDFLVGTANLGAAGAAISTPAVPEVQSGSLLSIGLIVLLMRYGRERRNACGNS